jgi:hypothetical protein
LTNGAPDDTSKSIKQIIRGGDLPLSILIVGVGEKGFGKMAEIIPTRE